MKETKHKVGIIGAGVIADFHAQALQAIEGVELVAAYARNQDKADSFSQNYGCSGYSDLDEFLKHPGIDVVTIASVSGVHLEHASAAAKAGKHIICEKPLEVTPVRIDEMIKICEENSVMLSGIFPRRFNESTHIFKEAIDSGRLGKGGLEAHKGIEVEDVAVAMVEFESDARGVIQASTACYSNDGLPASIHVCGDQGSIMMVDDKFSIWDLKESESADDGILEKYGLESSQAGAGAADPKAIDFQWHQRNFENALNALSNEEKPEVDGKEGKRVVELICAIYESISQNGNKITLK